MKFASSGEVSPPTCCSVHPAHAHAVRHEAQNRGFVQAFLNDPRRFQTTAKTFMHQSVVKRRSLPPREPHKGCIRQILQPEILQLYQWMPFGDGQFYTLCGNSNLIQLCISLRHVEHEPGVQTSGPDGFYLLQTGRWCQLQLGVRLSFPEPPERLGHHTTP